MKARHPVLPGMTRRDFAASVAASLGSWPVLADDALAARLDAVVDDWVGGGRIVGAVVLIARNGQLAYERAAGFADREAGTPVASHTIFGLASMTKLLVSATALALVERGRLSLDDSVDRWLPYFHPALVGGGRPDITVRQLMTHTAGLSYSFLEQDDDRYRVQGIPEGPAHGGTITLERAMRRLAAVPLYYVPGTQWRYSLATDVLGAVIQRAGGMPLRDAVAQCVTRPLGMSDTAFGVLDRSRFALPYRDDAPQPVRMDAQGDTIALGEGIPLTPKRLADRTAYPSGGAGMSGTAGDYLRLLEALRMGGSPILGPRSAAALARHAIGDLRAWTEGEGWGFSLGAAVLLDAEAARTPQHAGTWQWGGVLGGHWFVDPTAKLTAVVLTNTAVAGVIGAFPAAVRAAVYGA